MKNHRFIFAVAALFLILPLTGCDEFDEPLTAADCEPGDYFDAEDEACYTDEDDLDPAVTGSEDFFDDEDFYAAEIMTAADCFDDEYFDEEDQTCYLDDEAFEDEDGPVSSWLAMQAEELLDNNVAFSDGEDSTVLVQYTIQGDGIVSPQQGEAATGAAGEIQDDAAVHQALWDQFAGLIPQEYRREITQFGVFTDGEEETLAYVEPNPDNPTTWLIVLDPADAGNQDDFTYTLIHEYGHILTLNDRQVPFDEEAYFDEEGSAAEAADQACSTFFTGEGCAQSTSYISAFYDAFWADIYDELPFPDEEGIVDEDELADFYERYADRFVTDYAATNPGEDIAESWTHFVLKPKPAGSTPAEQKILFFYNYQELLAVRQAILSRLTSQSRR